MIQSHSQNRCFATFLLLIFGSRQRNFRANLLVQASLTRDLHENCLGSELLIKYMMRNDISVNCSVVLAEIQIRHRNVPIHHLLRRPPALTVCSCCKARCHTSACHRRKLPALINDTHNRIRETVAGDTVQDHTADCQLAFVRFSLSLTLNNAGQQF